MCYLCQAVSSQPAAPFVPGSNLFGGGGYISQFVGAVPDTGNPLIDGLASWTRQLPIGQPVNVKYSFNVVADYPSRDYTQPIAYNSAQRANTLISMQEFSKAANITWTEADTGFNINFGVEQLNPTNSGNGVQGVTWFHLSPQAVMSSPTGIVMNTHSSLGNFGLGETPFGGYANTHEMGHAMGLKHPFQTENYNGSTDPVVPSYMNNAGWSVMAYTDGSQVARSEVRSLAPGDVAAMRLLYGTNMNTNAGNTTYDLSSSAYSGYRTICDPNTTNSNDTFMATGAVGNCTIDLRNDIGNQTDGLHMSKVTLAGGGIAKVVIAGGDWIENAIAGAGADTVWGNAIPNYLYGGNDTIKAGDGNDALFGGMGTGANNTGNNSGSDDLYGEAGSDIIFGNDGNDKIFGGNGTTDTSGATNNNDILYGGLGDDILYGGQGADILIGAAGSDTLYGGTGNDIYGVNPLGCGIDYFMQFEGPGVPGGDIGRILKTTVNGVLIDTFAELMALATTDGHHTVFNFGGGNIIFVAWRTPTQFGAGDFEFVTALV
jgi:serralysin